MKAEHNLKILPEYYEQVFNRNKTFVLRKDDRGFQVGDRLVLNEFDGERLTGRCLTREITYCLRNCSEYGLKNKYVILGIQ